MAKSPLFFHFIPHGFEKTVIDSQVIVPALKLKSEGCPVHLVFLEPFVSWLKNQAPSARRELDRRVGGLSYSFLPRFPRNYFRINTMMVMLRLLWPLLSGRRVLVHARGLQGAAWIVPLKKIFKNLSVICDIRGIEWEEYAYTVSKAGKEPLTVLQRDWKKKLEKLARRAMSESDVKFCVSKSMMVFLQDWLGEDDEGGWEYIPCAVEADHFSSAASRRDEMRKRYNVSDRVVVAYSGAFRDWQLPKETVQCFKLIQEINPRAFFLCLSPDEGRFSRMLARWDVKPEDSLVRRVPHHEVADYLAMADLGILLREDNILNAYSCPTKFAEYLACGLHVASTVAIRDVSGIIFKESVGTILTNLKSDEQTSEQLKTTLEKVSAGPSRIEHSMATARSLYDWSRYTPLIKKWYLSLTSRP